MRLIMLTGLSGPEICLARNDPYEPETDREAIRLIDAGFAEAEDPEEEKVVREQLAAAKVEQQGDGSEPADQSPVADEPGATDGGETSKVASGTADDAAADPAGAQNEAADAADGSENAAEVTLDDGGTKATVDAPAFADLSEARKAYKAALNKNPAPNWSIEQLAAKIAEKQG